MNILVTNSSGDSGKTTIVREMLYPRIKDLNITEFSINSGNERFPELKPNLSKLGYFHGSLELMIETISEKKKDNVIDVACTCHIEFYDFAKESGNYIFEDELDLIIVPAKTKYYSFKGAILTIDELLSIDCFANTPIILLLIQGKDEKPIRSCYKESSIVKTVLIKEHLMLNELSNLGIVTTQIKPVRDSSLKKDFDLAWLEMVNFIKRVKKEKLS